MHKAKFLVPSLALSCVLSLLFAASPILSAQELLPAAGQETSAVISGPEDIGVGRTIILDASASRIAGENADYRWTIDETKQQIGRGVEAIYTPEKPGTLTFRLTVRSTNLSGNLETSEATHVVTAYSKKIVLIADTSVPGDKLDEHASNAMKTGVFIRILQPESNTPTLGTEDALFSQLSERKNVLNNADAIVIWTESIAGLQALMRAASADNDMTVQLKNQSLILFTEQSLSTLERTTKAAYSVLAPREIIITRKEAMNPLIEASSLQVFKETLVSRDIDSVSLTASSLKTRFWNVISMLVNYLLSHGVSGQTVILLLMLPVIATIFTFLKQVVGITTFGLYTPSIVALSFLALGWWVGLFFLIFILFTGYVTRSVMKRWRLLYIPKVAIVLTVVSFSLLGLVAIGSALGIAFNRDAVFMLLIMSTLAENFLSLKTEEGWWAALAGVTETVLGSILCVFIVQWQELQSFVLAYPEIILLTIPINIFLGRFTGLRLLEYFRFREVFKHLEEEE